MNSLIKQIVESKFNFNIDIEDNAQKNSLSKSSFNSKSLKQTYKEYTCVDLGLPSRTLWYKYNLGCNFDLLNNNPEQAKPKDWYGNYYAWGETAAKQDYSWKTYAYGSSDESLTKYCPANKSDYWGGSGDPDDLKVLTLEDDAARHNQSFVWRMPSSELLQELCDCTNNKWTYDYNGTGVAGQVFKGNNQELFIPAAGFYNGSDLSNAGDGALLWSSSLDTDNPSNAWHLYFDSDSIGMLDSNRRYGFSARPVLLNK